METSAEQNILFVIVIGTLGMLLLVVAIILFILVYQRRMISQKMKLQAMEKQHQQELLEATIDIQEQERNRIAQDLHDDIGAMLSAVKLGMNVIHRKVGQNEELTGLTTESKNMIDEAIGNVRRISKELLPATLQKFGLIPALDELCSKTTAATQRNIDFEHNDQQLRYDYKHELAVFRVSQELLNNSLKHAQATETKLALQCDNSQIELYFEDNGVGFDMNAVRERAGSKSGLGLKNIESRLSIVPTKIVYDTSPGEGFKVNIRLTTPAIAPDVNAGST